MTSQATWLSVLRKLTDMTNRDQLRWDPTSARGQRGFLSAVMDPASIPKTFRVEKNHSAYELSASNSFGHAPFELKVFRKQDSGSFAFLETINSNLRLGDMSSIMLNSSLETLWLSVSRAYQTRTGMIDDLLADLDD